MANLNKLTSVSIWGHWEFQVKSSPGLLDKDVLHCARHACSQAMNKYAWDLLEPDFKKLQENSHGS